jgi:hypothetical protein
MTYMYIRIKYPFKLCVLTVSSQKTELYQYVRVYSGMHLDRQLHTPSYTVIYRHKQFQTCLFLYWYITGTGFQEKYISVCNGPGFLVKSCTSTSIYRHRPALYDSIVYTGDAIV